MLIINLFTVSSLLLCAMCRFKTKVLHSVFIKNSAQIKIIFIEFLDAETHLLMLLVLVCPIRLKPFENLTVFAIENPAQKTDTVESYLVEG